MFARFDENPAMTLQDIKETKRYGRTHARTDGRTDNVKTVYPPQTKFAGSIIKREILTSDYDKGGLRMIDVEKFIWSLTISWVNVYYKQKAIVY